MRKPRTLLYLVPVHETDFVVAITEVNQTLVEGHAQSHGPVLHVSVSPCPRHFRKVTLVDNEGKVTKPSTIRRLSRDECLFVFDGLDGKIRLQVDGQLFDL